MCPFCGRDPYHRTDSGEAVAVTCCDLGDMFFRGARKEPEEVIMSWEDFEKTGSMLAASMDRIARAIEALDEGAPNIALSILNGEE